MIRNDLKNELKVETNEWNVRLTLKAMSQWHRLIEESLPVCAKEPFQISKARRRLLLE